MDLDPSWMVHAKLAFASLCGGIVRLLFRPAASLLKTAWLLFGCVTCGFYGTPVAIRIMDLDPVDYSGAVGALIGLVGLSLAQGALQAADKFDITSWITKKV